MNSPIITGIGQDSHVFIKPNSTKALVLGGVKIPDCAGLEGNSDADVIIHALCNAISSITAIPFLGVVTDKLCQQGITDSTEYLKKQLAESTIRVEHIAISVEAQRPKLIPWIAPIQKRIAELVGIIPNQVGITATSGETLSAYGRGEGIMANVIISARREQPQAPLLVLISCPDTNSATRLTQMLIEERLAACVQQLAINSSYSWQNKISTEDEILLLVKTRNGRYSQLASRITEVHPYEVPQLTVLQIDDGLPAYLKWLVAQTSNG